MDKKPDAWWIYCVDCKEELGSARAGEGGLESQEAVESYLKRLAQEHAWTEHAAPAEPPSYFLMGRMVAIEPKKPTTG